MKKIIDLLKTIGIPFAYDHFAEGESPEPPFICFLTAESDNFSADNVVYFRAAEVHIEVYTDRKDRDTERRVENALDAAGIFYQKIETWIGSEKLYEVMYIFETEED